MIIKTGDLKAEYLYEVEDYITEEGLINSSAKLYEIDTVLVAMYGATIGATSILKMPACTNQACAAFRQSERVVPEYLYYFLKSQKSRLVKDGVGGAQPNISARYLKRVQMELLSIDEQKAIVNILDKVTNVINKREEEIQFCPIKS
ncbi:MAG: restriction endonuclease subunit S [Ruminococcus sp.]|nr:restriction endonuclease subunit S [Ruminococcus sp.]